MKNFHIYDIFFRYIININIITLVIEIVDYKDINKFWLWITPSN